MFFLDEMEMPSIFGAPRGWRRPLILTAAGEAIAAFRMVTSV
jgi:hypothetical protein